MSSSRTKNKKPPGQVRQSQMVTTFGPGSMFDLPNHSVIVGGLEYWTKGDEVLEPRLVAKLKELLQIPILALHAPPPDNEDPTSTQKTGITCWQFPEWFITQGALATESGRSTRSRRLLPRSSLSKGKFVDHNKKSQPVVPVRFVRACRKGHIGDIDWYYFVHQGTTTCRRDLWIDERGTSGDLSEVWVRWECKAERQMIQATKPEMHALGRCNGWQPWLGPRVFEPCDEPNRLLIRTASNAYFPQTMSVISLPDRDEAVAKAVDQVWEHHLQHVNDPNGLAMIRKIMPPVAAALEGLSDEAVFGEMQARKQGRTPGLDKSVKQAEFETLVSAKEEIGSDKPDGDFFARYLPKKHWDNPWMAAVERVVLVHRLREVIATVGFTRFDPSSPDVEGELEIGVTRAQLARDVSWLPAIENRGEGIFIQFKSEAIDAWMEKPAVKRRRVQLMAGFDSWKEDHDKSNRKFFGLPYTLLHSLSHQLITSVSLECGYPASSIRERIYSGPYGDGILLYTGTSDAEGTMGGLVQAGRQIARYLKAAIDLGRLCSNDPVCAQHAPENQHECRFLHGAALPRLPADCGDVLRAAQRFPRQSSGDLHSGRQRCRVLPAGRIMTSALCQLTPEDLSQLAGALRSGRIARPFSPLVLRRYVSESMAALVAIELQQRVAEGMESRHLADCLEILCQDRRQRPLAEDLIDLVWTGPEAPGIVNRDTSVVVREMFRSAKESVLLAGYAVYQGHVVFKELAERMDQTPELQVQMYLDIQRPHHDQSSSLELVRIFADRFVRMEWPGRRRPKCYYDPRSLEADQTKRTSLHAKCVVVDKEEAFVSLANFTEAAQTRNIEVGVLLRSQSFARKLSNHFESLAALSILKPIPLGGPRGS